jgi:23S rRNA (uracil1939-C5)-methyltransferase
LSRLSRGPASNRSDLAAGTLLELTIERPVAGGRMLARAADRIVLVAGAIPDERVLARIERTTRQVAFATTERVIKASPARGVVESDPRCGGLAYAHVTPEAQLEIKREVVLDALRRGGRIAWTGTLVVRRSPEHGYRMRARLHVRAGRVGFFREGTHDVCSAGRTGQLLPATVDAIERFVASLPRDIVQRLDALELTENLSGDQRVLHLLWRLDRDAPQLDTFDWPIAGVTGVTVRDPASGSPIALAGTPFVSDPLARFTGSGEAGTGPTLRRHAPAFFQANRFLARELVRTVVGYVGRDPVVDLYAGVGLFAVALAASGREQVVAVEGDPISSADLLENARAFQPALTVERSSVEIYLGRASLPERATIVLDPPRTGLSRRALELALAAGASDVVYVSCDVATLARDLRRFLNAGYALTNLEAFDLFPNTPHVECVAVLNRALSRP